MELCAVGGHPPDAAVDAIEDHFVVSHVGAADDGAVVLVIEDAEAPHALAELVRVLPRAEGEGDAVAKVQRVRRQLVELGRRHREAVVVGVLALRHPARARAPRAVRPEEVAHRAVRLREAEEAVRVEAVEAVGAAAAEEAAGARARTVGGRYIKVVPESTMVER